MAEAILRSDHLTVRVDLDLGAEITHIIPAGGETLLFYGDWKSPLLCAHPFKDGETFMFESTGGGGYGKPWEREAAQVLEDVLDEYVSLGAARERYGVVIDTASMQIDAAATASCEGA